MHVILGYPLSHWRGKHSLAYSYWINGAALTVVFSIAAAVVTGETAWFENAWFSICFVSFAIVLTVWQLVGIWRSAAASVSRAVAAIPKGSTFWARAAQVMVILGVIRALGEWAPVVEDIGTAWDLRNEPIATQYYVELIGDSDVVLTGFINEKSVDAVLEAFEDKRRGALVINSPGGILVSAFRLADFVSENSIVVAAHTQCVSACMLVLAASDTAATAPDAELVFHSAESRAEFVSAGFKEQMRVEEEEYYTRFSNYGVPESLLEDFQTRAFTPLSITDAYNASFIDLIWIQKSNEFVVPRAFCKEHECSVATPLSNN